VQVKNPWAHKRWMGQYSATDLASWTPELRRALKYDPVAAQSKDDGIFWIEWGSIRQYFNTIFLNWNPSLFAYTTCTHALWPATQGPKNDSYYLGQNPQFSLTVTRAAQGPFPSRWQLMEGWGRTDFFFCVLVMRWS
jgi:calpain-7